MDREEMTGETTGTARQTARPLCVDLDGTLVRTDTLYECALKAAATAPFATLIALFRGALAALRGDRTQGKRDLAEIARPDASLLPYREDLLKTLRKERKAGRRLVLATGADERIARDVAEHLDLFDETIGTRPGVNMISETKAAALTKRFGARGFDYVGDSKQDIAVWSEAADAWIAGRRVSAKAVSDQTGRPAPRRFDDKPTSLREWIKAVRVYQWIKNALVFAPAVAAGTVFQPQIMLWGAIAFLLLSLCAAGTYLLNDLLDLESDRRHPNKRRRPLASGALPIRHGLVASASMIFAALLGAALSGPALFGALMLYLVTTVLYSFWLKRIAVVDVFTLAGLYGLRLVAGAVAIGVTLSVWLLNFAVFFFLSLACLKRVGELMGQEARLKTIGRGYHKADRALVAAFGLAIGVASSVVFGLYVASPQAEAIYASPEWLWGAAPLFLMWLTRLWLFTWRGDVADDPIVTVLSDGVSWVVAGLSLLLFLAAHGALAPLGV